MRDQQLPFPIILSIFCPSHLRSFLITSTNNQGGLHSRLGTVPSSLTLLCCPSGAPYD